MLLVLPFVLPVVIIFVIAMCLGSGREAAAATIGFFLAAAVPICVSGTFVFLEGSEKTGRILEWSLLLYPFSLGFVIILGLPAFLALRPFRPGHWWSVGAAGMLLGLGVGAILRLPNPPLLQELMTTAPLGGLAAIVFWLVWRYGGGMAGPRGGDGSKRAASKMCMGAAA
jgi:hypothetical protein